MKTPTASFKKLGKKITKKLKWWDLIFLAILAFVLTNRAPVWLSQWKAQGHQVPATQLETLENQLVTFPSPNEGKSIVVFWATWCGPCTVELDRLKEASVKGDLDPKRIVTVSVGEDPELVRRTVSERGYPFRNLVDGSGSFARIFNVQATPTVAFLDGPEIEWMTSGLSPTLVFRAERHLNSK